MAIKRKILSISLPPKMERDIALIAKKEEKTRSELIREAMRFFLEKKGKKIK